MVPLWEAIVTVVLLFTLAVVWKAHAGKIVLLFAVAIAAREAYRYW